MSAGKSDNDRRGIEYLERWIGVGTGQAGKRPVPRAVSADAVNKTSSSGPDGSQGPPLRKTAMRIYSRTYLIPTLQLCRHDTQATLRTQLKALAVQHRSMFFNGGPVILDMGNVSQDGSPHARPLTQEALSEVLEVVREMGLVPVGVCNGSHDVDRVAVQAGVPKVMLNHSHTGAGSHTGVSNITPEVKNITQVTSSSAIDTSIRKTTAVQTSSGTSSAPFTQTPPRPAPPIQNHRSHHEPKNAAKKVEVGDMQTAQKSKNSPVTLEVEKVERKPIEIEEHVPHVLPEALEAMLYTGTVRGGQQVYAEGRSLVVVGSVSSLGEVLADGDIHVYGVLRGRALAGLGGNMGARIFATKFDAELVGVCDVIQPCESPEGISGLVPHSPTVVSLRGGKLLFQSMTDVR